MHRVERWPVFFSLVILLIAAGVLRSAWATRLDGFTIDEPWHITAGAAYLRTGEFYLNPEHPPLVKIVAGLAAPRSVFQFANPGTLRDKRDERKFVEETMYARNDADLVQSRVCHVPVQWTAFVVLCGFDVPDLWGRSCSWGTAICSDRPDGCRTLASGDDRSSRCASVRRQCLALR